MIAPYVVALSVWRRGYLLAVLREVRGNQLKAAPLIGVHRNTLNRLLQQSGITRQVIREQCRPQKGRRA